MRDLKFDVVIIGGGAAGLFCAIEAGRRGRKVLVIERNAHVGRKIIISGGGRCNFTNASTTHENFVSKNPHFCKSALARYTPSDFIALVKKHRIEFYEKKLGQLFCRESSRAIVDMLLKECERSRVKLMTGHSVDRVERVDHFHLETTAGNIRCDSLVIATGGLSFAKVGATDFGYKIAKQFGLKIEPTRPSLVPLVFEGSDSSRSLAGISVDSIVSTSGHSFREQILFTHRGLSGPAILQISNYWRRDEPASIDLLPLTPVSDLLHSVKTGRKLVSNLLSMHLPEKIVATILPSDLARKTVEQLTEPDIERIQTRFNSWSVKFKDTEGYDKAEVTAGGVSTDELSSQSMEARRVSGLFFVGEVVDVTGWLGGYNFQWAWSSGHAAGQVV
ncbi:MAG TPA: NAD(P)/FAD-dependent oxidoreductase [Pyrinomonadaceae bacterium]|nr:NAD(P)/FAD-dependent oxidoreductase [Pyrinomonadaceae bacterium]